MRVLLYAKMRNKIENEETKIFRQIFVIGGISIEGTRAPRPPPGYAYDFEIRSRPKNRKFMEKNKSYIDQRLTFTNYIICLVCLFVLLRYSFKEQLRLLTHRA